MNIKIEKYNIEAELVIDKMGLGTQLIHFSYDNIPFDLNFVAYINDETIKYMPYFAEMAINSVIEEYELKKKLNQIIAQEGL